MEYFVERYRVEKIEVIVQDFEHAHDSGLSRDELRNYVWLCGAEVNASTPVWTVTYDKWFHHRQWAMAPYKPVPETTP